MSLARPAAPLRGPFSRKMRPPLAQAPDPMLQPPLEVRRPALSGNALAVASILAWSAGFPAADILLDSWDPLALIAARLAGAVAMLLPVWLILDGPRAVMGARWGRGLFVGGIAFGFGAWLLVIAQSLTDAVTVAIIASACPVAAVIVEMIWEKRRLSAGFVAGLVATVVGGIVATGGGGVALGLGALVAVASCFLFSWGSFLTVRDFPTLSPIGRTTLTLAGGLLAMGTLVLGADLAGMSVLPETRIDRQQIGLLAIYALAGMALSQVMWIASVGRLGIAVASFHINVAPFYVMLYLLALGGGWDWQAALGAAIVAAGVVLAQR